MELIAKLIELALVECYDRGAIDWLPGDGMPESFYGECEIESNRYYVGPAGHGYWNGDYFVTLFGVFTIIDAEHLETWHSSRLHPKYCSCDECEEVRVAYYGQA